MHKDTGVLEIEEGLPLDLPTWKRIVANVDTRIADQRSKPQKLELFFVVENTLIQ